LLINAIKSVKPSLQVDSFPSEIKVLLQQAVKFGYRYAEDSMLLGKHAKNSVVKPPIHH